MSEVLRLPLVDDDEVDRAAVQRALQVASLDAELREATSVTAARKLLAEIRFDALLLDYNLPDGCGRELLESVAHATDPTPVIVLTGQGDEALAVELMKIGARDYIPKHDLSPARLAQSLRHVVEVSRAEREAARARRGQQFLSDASARLAQSLDTNATLEQIARLAVPEMADHCVLHVVEADGSVRAGAACHLGAPDSEQGAQGMRGSEGFVSAPVLQALNTERPVVLNQCDDSANETPLDEDAPEILERLGVCALVALPLWRGHTLGVLTVAHSNTGRRYDDQDLTVSNLRRAQRGARQRSPLRRAARRGTLAETLRATGERSRPETRLRAGRRGVADRATESIGASGSVRVLHVRRTRWVVSVRDFGVFTRSRRRPSADRQRRSLPETAP